MVVLLCLLLGGSAYLYQYGYEMKISEAELQQKINTKLPFSRNYYVMFKTTLDNAQVELIQDNVRIQFNARFESLNPNSLLNKLIHGSNMPLLSGSVDVIALPEYDPETGKFFLSQAKLVGLDLKGVRNSKKYEQSVQKLVVDYLARHSIYTLKETDFKKLIAKYFLKKVRVKDHELQLVFGI